MACSLQLDGGWQATPSITKFLKYLPCRKIKKNLVEFQNLCKQFDELVIYRWLETDQNSENIQFIQHHIVRSAGTMIIHLCLPLIYLFGYSYFALVVDASFNTIDDLIDTYPPFYYCVILATLLVISAFTLVYYWSLESWKFHPFVKKVCTIFLLWGSY